MQQRMAVSTGPRPISFFALSMRIKISMGVVSVCPFIRGQFV